MLVHSDIPDWVIYLAQDADGQWWGYEAEPNLSHLSWYENEVGRIVKLGKTEADIHWQQSLTKVADR